MDLYGRASTFSLNVCLYVHSFFPIRVPERQANIFVCKENERGQTAQSDRGAARYLGTRVAIHSLFSTHQTAFFTGFVLFASARQSSGSPFYLFLSLLFVPFHTCVFLYNIAIRQERPTTINWGASHHLSAMLNFFTASFCSISNQSSSYAIL